MRGPPASGALLLVAVVIAQACAEPTAIEVTVYSEVPCTVGSEVEVAIAADGPSLASALPATTATVCEDAGRGSFRRGSFVIAPQDANEKLVAFQLTTRNDSHPLAECNAGLSKCITARRQLRFQPGETVALDVSLRLSCLGISCPGDQTCVKGACVELSLCGATCAAEAAPGAVQTIPDAGTPVQTRTVCGDMSGVAAGSPWPMLFGWATNAGRSRFNGPASGGTALAPAGPFTNARGAVVGATNTVYLQHSEGLIAAHDGTTGAEQWRSTAFGGNQDVPLLTQDNGLFVTTSYGMVGLLDAATGALRWKLQLSGAYSSPVMGATRIAYFGANSPYGFYAVNTAAGVQRWHFDIPENGASSNGAPALGSDAVYFIDSVANRLYSLDAASGAQRFVVSVSNSVIGSAVLGLDAVYVSTPEKGILAFDASTGGSKWTHPVGERVIQPALLSNGDLVSGTASGRGFVLDRATGNEIRTIPIGGRIESVSVGLNDTIYYATDRSTVAITPANTTMWQSNLTGHIAIVNDRVVVVPTRATSFGLIGPIP